MTTQAHDWDFFLAHAGADKAAAESLYDLLSLHAKVFLDSRCLLLGDNWDEEIAKAQRGSLITVVLISSRTKKAYYQREEIAAAINMARKDKDQHRVVPVFLDGWPRDENSIPYGLRLKHGLSAPDIGEPNGVAARLLSLLGQLKGQTIVSALADQTKSPAASMQNVSYNTASIRRLLTEALTDDDLNSLCMDEFPKVSNQFSAGMNKAQKIQQLIEHCSRQNEFPKLLDLIRGINPNEFAKNESSLTR